MKSPSVTQRPVSQENAFKMSKNPSVFFLIRNTVDSNNSFTLIKELHPPTEDQSQPFSQQHNSH